MDDLKFPNKLPRELWFEILLHLPPDEVSLMRQLSRGFNGLISASEQCEYRRVLFLAGLEERISYDKLKSRSGMADLRDTVKAYCSRWKNFGSETALEKTPIRHSTVDAGHFISCVDAGDGMMDVHFARLPSPCMGIELYEWSIQLPGNCDFAIYPCEDLLAITVPEGGGRSFRVDLLDMYNRKPRFKGTKPPDMKCFLGEEFKFVILRLTGHRLAAQVELMSGIRQVFVWDWWDGKSYLKHFPVGAIDFIDEYRLLTTIRDDKNPALVLWDFSVDWKPGEKPTKLVLELEKPVSETRQPYIIRNYKSPKHTLPFREDPGAGIIVLSLKGTATGKRTFVVPVRVLAGLRIPENGRGSLLDELKLWPEDPMINEVTVKWNHWERFATLVEPPAAPGTVNFIFHSQLAYLVPTGPDLFLHVYDFSLYSRMGMGNVTREGRSNGAPSRPLQRYATHKVKLPVHSSNFSKTLVNPEGCILIRQSVVRFLPFRLVVEPTLPQRSNNALGKRRDDARIWFSIKGGLSAVWRG